MSNDGERCHLIFNILRFSKNLSDVLDLELSDHDGELALPPRGAKIKVAIGWCDRLRRFDCQYKDSQFHQVRSFLRQF